MEKYPMQYTPFGGSLQVKADLMSYYLAFACLCYIPVCTFQINSILENYCLGFASMPTKRTSDRGIYQKEEVYLKLFYLLRYKRLLHKCTEINAINFLYSFFCFSWKCLYFFIIVFYEI